MSFGRVDIDLEAPRTTWPRCIRASASLRPMLPVIPTISTNMLIVIEQSLVIKRLSTFKAKRTLGLDNQRRRVPICGSISFLFITFWKDFDEISMWYSERLRLDIM